MRFSYLATLLFLLLALPLLNGCSQAASETVQAPDSHISDAVEMTSPLHLTVALSYEGTEEISPNSSPVIDRFLRHVDLEPGLNYCAAFVSYVIDQSGVSYPDVQSGVAQHFITDRSIHAKHVLRGTKSVPGGDIVVWKRGSTWRGHTGFVASDWTGAEGMTIEANTTPGVRASPQAGDGVHRKERMIQPASYFRITHFTPVLYT